MNNEKELEELAYLALMDYNDTNPGKKKRWDIFLTAYLSGAISERERWEKEVERLRECKLHYDRIFSKSVVVPTEEYIENVKLRERVKLLLWLAFYFMVAGTVMCIGLGIPKRKEPRK